MLNKKDINNLALLTTLYVNHSSFSLVWRKLYMSVDGSLYSLKGRDRLDVDNLFKISPEEAVKLIDVTNNVEIHLVVENGT